MKLDAAQLRAEAEAHRQRMESPLWTPAESEGKQEASWTAALSRGPAAGDRPAPLRQAGPATSLSDPLPSSPLTMPAIPAPGESAATEILPRLEALDRSVERLAAAISRRPPSRDDVPAWLEQAAGDPRTYDAPDSARIGVCVRILPATYQQVQRAQRTLGLRTTAGVWEVLARLGLAALERLPST